MKGLYTKKLQQTDLYKELVELKQNYYELSLEKEHKQKSYLKNVCFTNQSTGEILQIDYDFEVKYKQYSKTTEQRVRTIEELAYRKDYISLFITLTLPSKFHPFKSVKRKDNRLYTSINKDFEFSSIDESITNGYKHLNNIYKTFYKRIKNYTKNELLYVKSIEPHNSMLPHLHLLLYFPLEHYEQVKTTFKRVVSHFELTMVDFQNTRMKENITYTSSYLLKYITKNLNSGSDYYQARVLDGWKRHHKIRVLSNSNIPLNLSIYKKIYYSISNFSKNKINLENDDSIKNVKEDIDEIVSKMNIPIYLFFQDNLFINKKIRCFNADGIFVGESNSTYGDVDSSIKVDLVMDRFKVKNKLIYKVKALSISYQDTNIYKKQRFLKIQGD